MLVCFGSTSTTRRPARSAASMSTAFRVEIAPSAALRAIRDFARKAGRKFSIAITPCARTIRFAHLRASSRRWRCTILWVFAARGCAERYPRDARLPGAGRRRAMRRWYLASLAAAR